MKDEKEILEELNKLKKTLSDMNESKLVLRTRYMSMIASLEWVLDYNQNHRR